MEHIIPDPLARWAVPTWAETSRLDDAGVLHMLSADGLCTLGDDDEPRLLGVTVTQADIVDVVAGDVRVIREGAPVVEIAGAFRLTLAQAEELGRALVQLAERCEL